MSSLMGMGSAEGIEDQVLGKLNQLKVRNCEEQAVMNATRWVQP